MNEHARLIRFVVTGLSLLFFLLFTAATASAQGDPPDNTALVPPPLRFVPREDRAQLDAERDVKKRTQLSIRLAEAHLARAEQLTDEDKYEEVTTELGYYEGVVDDALKYLATLPPKKNKIRDNSKRLELALRPHVSRLETMRRKTPASYGGNFKTMIEYVRAARDRALESFYDDTVLRDFDADAGEKRPPEPPAKPKGNMENALTPEKKPGEQY